MKHTNMTDDAAQFASETLALLTECMDFAWDDELRIEALPILLDRLAGSTAANDTRVWRVRLRRVRSATIATKGAL